MVAIYWIFPVLGARSRRSLFRRRQLVSAATLQPRCTARMTRRRPWESSQVCWCREATCNVPRGATYPLGRSQLAIPRLAWARSPAAGASFTRWARSITKLRPVGGFAAETAPLPPSQCDVRRNRHQHDPHHHGRDRGSGRDEATQRRAMGRRRTDCLGLDSDDSGVGGGRGSGLFDRVPDVIGAERGGYFNANASFVPGADTWGLSVGFRRVRPERPGSGRIGLDVEFGSRHSHYRL